MKATEFGQGLVEAALKPTVDERLDAMLAVLNKARVFGTETMANAVARKAHEAWAAIRPNPIEMTPGGMTNAGAGANNAGSMRDRDIKPYPSAADIRREKRERL